MDVPRGNAPGGVFSHFYQGTSEGRTYESVFGAVGWQRVDQRTRRRHPSPSNLCGKMRMQSSISDRELSTHAGFPLENPTYPCIGTISMESSIDKILSTVPSSSKGENVQVEYNRYPPGFNIGSACRRISSCSLA